MHSANFLSFILFILFDLCVCEQFKISTQHGEIEGEQVKNGQINYIKYLGIPYAQPPIGDLRFMLPKPVEGRVNQKKKYDMCLQKSSKNSNGLQGQEDCLYLNVYTPIKNSTGMGYKVMVWIHGGNFDSGSGTSDFNPDFLVHEEVIVVTFNYRLGVFGFLSLQNEAIPGNMGLRDQIMALTWVQKNIQNFGGDPYGITLFGTDAGAASIHYLLMSEKANYLFNRAILQSGSAYSPWALQTNVFERTRNFLTNLNLVEKDSLKPEVRLTTYNFTKFSTDDLYKAAQKVITEDDKSRQLNSVFVPVIEHESSKKPIVNDTIQKQMSSMKTKKIKWRPIIIGFNSEEGGQLFCNDPNFNSNWFNKENIEKYLPADVSYTLNKKIDTQTVYEKIHEEFIPGYNDTLEQIYVKLKGDLWYMYPVYRTAVEMAQNTDRFQVYFYRFSSNEKMGKLMCTDKKDKKDKKVEGANHGDETQYLFNQNTLQEKFKTVSQKVIKLWTQFAKHGNPTVNHNWPNDWINPNTLYNLWKKIDSTNDPEYFDLDKFKMQKLESSEFSRKLLWTKVYEAVQKRKDEREKRKQEEKTKS